MKLPENNHILSHFYLFFIKFYDHFFILQLRSNGVLPYMGYMLDSVGSTAIKERKHKPRHPGTPS